MFDFLLAPLVSGLLGAVFSSFFGGNKQATPQPQEPVKPQAPAVAPDIEPMRAANKASAAAQGPGSTMLTGLGGVDPSSLNLGKNLLLGQ